MMSDEIATIRLFDGMEAFFQRLKEGGVQLGMVSSNSESNIRTVLGAENARLFRHYECGVSLLGKAAKLRRAARRADCPIDRTLYVGDEIRDLEAADKAGIPFAGVGWGFATVQAFQKRNPRAVFRTIEEMGDYLVS
jgi:phosphoglycolate phosphatase